MRSKTSVDRGRDRHRSGNAVQQSSQLYGTSNPDNRCPATKPKLTHDFEAAGIRTSWRRIEST
jgi:hypothetical protein